MLIELSVVPHLVSLLKLDPVKDSVLITKALSITRAICLSSFLGASHLTAVRGTCIRVRVSKRSCQVIGDSPVLAQLLRSEKRGLHQLAAFSIMDVFEVHSGTFKGASFRHARSLVARVTA